MVPISSPCKPIEHDIVSVWLLVCCCYPVGVEDPVVNVVSAAALAGLADQGVDRVPRLVRHLDGWGEEGALQADRAELPPLRQHGHPLLAAHGAVRTRRMVNK